MERNGKVGRRKNKPKDQQKVKYIRTLKDVGLKIGVARFTSTFKREFSGRWQSLSAKDTIQLEKDYEAIERLKKRGYLSERVFMAAGGAFDECLAAAIIKQLPF